MAAAREVREPRWLSLAVVNAYVPLARTKGVSRVARSSRGFVGRYRLAGGDPAQLGASWRKKRAGFVARHMAQAVKNGEAFLRTGELSRRHLALIMWAFSPNLALYRR